MKTPAIVRLSSTSKGGNWNVWVGAIAHKLNEKRKEVRDLIATRKKR